jgi:DNA-binding transcriptional LysR family regulator
MKLEQLRYFIEAARQEHVGKAAAIVHISPSAISHSIAALERELGRELFVKKGKNIQLTNHGKLLMERAEGILNGLEAIKDELASDRVDLQGHYRLAGTHLLSSVFLTPAWSAVQKSHAQLTAEIYSLRSSQVISGVMQGEYDLGLCLSPQPHPSLEIETVFKGRLLPAVRRGHPLLKKPDLKALSSYPAVLPKAYQGVDNCETHPMFARFGIAARPEVIFDSYAVAAARIAATDGWGLLPDLLIGSGLSALPAPKRWDAPYTVAILRPAHRVPTRVLRRLSPELKRRISRHVLE